MYEVNEESQTNKDYHRAVICQSIIILRFFSSTPPTSRGGGGGFCCFCIGGFHDAVTESEQKTKQPEILMVIQRARGSQLK